jgi:hypothetical protein
MIFVRIDLHTKLLHQFSIDRDLSAGDEFIGFSAGGNSGRGDKAIEPDSVFLWLGACKDFIF